MNTAAPLYHPEPGAHVLKTTPIFFEMVRNGMKPFEIRNNDRNFKQGDVVVLAEYNPDHKAFTKRTAVFRIGIMIKDFIGLAPGYVAFTLVPHANEGRDY